MTEVTCAVIIRDDKILLTQRGVDMSHPNRWEFPGGKLKPGESPEKAIVREIREELNASVKVEQLLPSIVYDYGSGRIKLIPFICSLVDDQIVLSEHQSYSWIGRDELMKYDILEADIEVINKLNVRLKLV